MAANVSHLVLRPLAAPAGRRYRVLSATMSDSNEHPFSNASFDPRRLIFSAMRSKMRGKRFKYLAFDLVGRRMPMRRAKSWPNMSFLARHGERDGIVLSDSAVDFLT